MPSAAMPSNAEPCEVQSLAAFHFRKLSHEELSELSIFLWPKITQTHAPPRLFQNLPQDIARITVWKIIFHQNVEWKFPAYVHLGADAQYPTAFHNRAA